MDEDSNGEVKFIKYFFVRRSLVTLQTPKKNSKCLKIRKNGTKWREMLSNALYKHRLLTESHVYENILTQIHLNHTFAGGLLGQNSVNFSKKNFLINFSTFSTFPFFSHKGVKQV